MSAILHIIITILVNQHMTLSNPLRLFLPPTLLLYFSAIKLVHIALLIINSSTILLTALLVILKVVSFDWVFLVVACAHQSSLSLLFSDDL